MGFDIVDLVIAMEGTFGIEISEDETCRVKTLGDLFGLVLWKTGHLPEGCTGEGLAEARVRDALASALARAPDSFSLEDSLARLIPVDGRRRCWDEIRNRLEPDLPGLQFHRRLRRTFAGGLLLAGGIGLVLMVLGSGRVGVREVAWDIHALGACMALFSLAAAVLLPSALRGFRICFAPEVATVEGLVSELVELERMKLGSSLTGLKVEEAWALFAETAARQMGLPLERIVRGARLVEDLSAG